MKVKYLIKRLKKLNQDSDILISKDAELNRLFNNIFIDKFDTVCSDYVLYPDENSERTQEIEDSIIEGRK